MRIFIGYDSTQAIAYDVLKFSITSHCPQAKIFPLRLSEIRTVFNFSREHDPLQSTEFTYTRFLIPYICDYKGLALFMDSDMLCLSNIGELFSLDMTNYALRVVKHVHNPTTLVKMTGKVQTVYPRKNWSSLMLMDCSKLTSWTKESVELNKPKWLHRFESIPDEQIGDIPQEWNELDTYGPDTKMIHYTEGGPWLPNYHNHQYGDVWFKYAKEYLYG